MILFKEFYSKTENSSTFLPKETIIIRDVGTYIAKVDTGNDAYNALHGEDVKIKGDTVTFKTDKGKEIQKPLIDTIKINIGASNVEDRPIVKFDFKLKGKVYKNVKFSICDRKDNDEKVLLGLEFLKLINAVVKVK
jgi:hypothetical protein